jgi:Domain of unknown function (DUF4360)
MTLMRPCIPAWSLALAIAGCAADTGDRRAGLTGDEATAGIPDEATISASAGVGCGPLDVRASDDHEALTALLGDGFFARDSPEVSNRELHCTIGVDYTYPAGWRFWRPRVQVRGALTLEDTAYALIGVAARWGDRPWAQTSVMTPGLVADDPIDVVLDDGSASEEPTLCGATSTHVDITVDGQMGGTGYAQAEVFSIDAAISWERCP